MRIVHVSKIEEALRENAGQVVFIIHSHECAEKLLQALENVGCTWVSGKAPTYLGVSDLYVPGGVRVENGRMLKGDLEDYQSGYIPYVPRLRVVL
jgi:hypothetical protein